jgi:ArsR family transcriptional regulator
MMTAGSLDDVLAGLRAVAEGTRLRLAALCAEGDLTVGDLCAILGQSQPRVSRHLKLLCEAGVLERFPEGTAVFHRLADERPGATLARRVLGLLPRDDATLRLDRERLGQIRAERAAAAAAYFRKNAAHWGALRSLYVDEQKVEAELLRRLPAEGIGALLDIGTGTGRILELLAGRVRQGIGIDLSRDMLLVARAKLQSAGIANCQVRQADMYRLPWQDPQFDAITLHRVLHYAEEPARVIAEAARVLRPNGRLLIIDFAPHGLERLRTEHAHRRLGFSDAEIGKWCRAAGLTPEPAQHLPGAVLTVSIWQALRAPRRAAAPAGPRKVAA